MLNFVPDLSANFTGIITHGSVHTQTSGRPRKIWIIALGYFSDTRYMDKVAEKKQEHVELCHLLATEGYDVMLLPIVLGSAGHFSNALIVQQKKWTAPKLGQRIIQQAPLTQYTHHTNLVS